MLLKVEEIVFRKKHSIDLSVYWHTQGGKSKLNGESLPRGIRPLHDHIWHIRTVNSSQEDCKLALG